VGGGPFAHWAHEAGDCDDLAQHVESVAKLGCQAAEPFGAGRRCLQGPAPVAIPEGIRWGA